jgi:hypothetical protein
VCGGDGSAKREVDSEAVRMGGCEDGMAIGYANGVDSPLGACEFNRNLFIFNLIVLQSYSLTAYIRSEVEELCAR